MKPATIVDIRWDKNCLLVELDGSEDKPPCLLSDRGIVVDFQATNRGNEHTYKINITNALGRGLLPQGNWEIADRTTLFALFASSEVLLNLDNAGKTFQYRKSTREYTVKICLVEKFGSARIYLQPSFSKRVTRDSARLFLVDIGKSLVNIFYHFLLLFHIKNKSNILFLSENSESLSGNLSAIERRFKERGLDERFQVKILCDNIVSKFSIFKIIRTLNAIAWADYVFVEDYVPVFASIKLSKKTKLIQTWHAGYGYKAVGFKRFGLNNSPNPNRCSHNQYSYALVGNEFLKETYEEVFGIEKEALIASGMPRLDHFLNEDFKANCIKSFEAEFPKTAGKNVILYAPTYRGANQKKANVNSKLINFDELAEFCNETNSCIVFKMHKFLKKKIKIPNKYQEFMFDASGFEINELMHACDVLVTDYSSCFYDWLLTEKPCIFYVPDLYEYSALRGIQDNPLLTAPGPVCLDASQLISELNIAIKGDLQIQPNKMFIDASKTSDKLGSDIAIDNILLIPVKTKKVSKIKQFFISFGIKILRLVYAFLKLFPTQNKYLFLSKLSDKPPRDFSILKQAINDKRPDVDVVILAKSMDNRVLYVFHMLRQMYHLATSKVVFLDRSCLAVHVLNHKPELRVVQMWHAVGSMKKFGYANLDTPEGQPHELARLMSMHKKYTDILISSDDFIGDFIEGFNILPSDAKQIVSEIPLPRCDVLTDKDRVEKIKSDLFKKHPRLNNGKTNILYCPTYRKTNPSEDVSKKGLKSLVTALDADKSNLIYSPHPLSRVNLESDVIMDIKASTIDLLCVADVVISDYSSIIYEAGLLNLPVYLYAYDWNEYISEREMNCDIEHDIPAYFAKDARDLVKAIEGNCFKVKEFHKFTNKYIHMPTDRSCCESIINLVSTPKVA